jgi:iodotyrosine deiodinase
MQTRKMIGGYPYIQYNKETFDNEEAKRRTDAFYQWLDTRRTVRDFSAKEIDRSIIESIIKAASTAPSGAHKQPWTFCVVSDPQIKKQIREAAEQEEYQSYHSRMSDEWLQDLAPLGTDWHKPFLETAPYLLVVFKRSYEFDENGKKRQNYYVTESCGLACGFLLAAIHQAGLVALTHTPSPMNFLARLLQRPENEKPFLLIPFGYPAEEIYVPDLKRKDLDEVAVWY